MDFTAQQINTLRAIMGEVMDIRFRENNELLRQEVRDSARNTQDLLMQEMRALEHRIDARAEQKKEEIIDFIDASLLPQIDVLDKRVTSLEAKSAMN